VRTEEFVRSLYATRTEGSLQKIILDELLNFVPGQNAVVNSFDLTTGKILPVVFSHPPRKGFLEATKAYMHQHPTFRDLCKRQHRYGRVISDFLTQTQWHQTELYNEAYGPGGFEDQIGIGLCRSGRHCTGVAVLRDKKGFSPNDRRRVAALTPHLEQALINARAFERLQLSVDRSQIQLDACPYGTIWLNEGLRVVGINPRATAWWSEFFPHDRVTSRLPQALEAWMQASAHSWRSPLGAGATKSFTCCSQAARLVVRGAWFPKKKAHLLALERRRLFPGLEDLRNLPLTPKEAEVLLWLARGKTNGEISRILGGSRRTIDKHVQNLLAKLMLENRAAAILLVADLLHG
jgi:DNA-binding CsgD family transcriptional regulator